MHVAQPTECYGEGRLIMYIAEPDPSVNKNGSVHERVGIETGVRSCESNRPPVEAQPGERACAANHPGGVLIGSDRDTVARAYSFSTKRHPCFWTQRSVA